MLPMPQEIDGRNKYSGALVRFGYNWKKQLLSNFRSFFVKLNNIDKKHFFLDDEESHHIINVLRLKIDDKIYLIDGFGTAYSAIIDHISKEKVSGKITDNITNEPLIGVNVMLVGTTLGSATDQDGFYHCLLYTSPSPRD